MRIVGSAEAEATEQLGLRGPRLPSGEYTRAVGFAEGEGFDAAMPYRPETYKQGGLEGRRVGRSRTIPSSWGHIDRGLTISGVTRAVRSAGPKAAVQLVRIGRRVTNSEAIRAVGSFEADVCRAAGAVEAEV